METKSAGEELRGAESVAARQGEESPRRRDVLGSPEVLRRTVGARLRELGQPAYRLEQVENWIYEQRATSFREMTTLPRGLREELEGRFSLTPLEAAFTARSRDGTVKHLWRLEDGQQVESVLIPTEDRLTLCLSSQVGCALACRFCATGSFGFRRQLSSAEITAQFREADRFARSEMDRPVTNVVYMGMGEPFANRDAVFESLEALHRGFGIGARRITVSTVGIVPGIRRMTARPEPFGLAVSLHAPESDLRASIMPVEKRYPIPELMEAIREYVREKGRRVTFEYTLIREVNDRPREAEGLVELVGELTCFVNLIPWNPIPDRDWEPSTPERVRRFARILHRGGLSCAVREPRGRDIAAACGQLRLEKEGLDENGGDGAD